MDNKDYFYYYQILAGMIYLIPLSIISDRYNSFYARINALDKWILKGEGDISKTIERSKELTQKANKIKRIAFLPFLVILFADLILTYKLPNFGYAIPVTLFFIFYLAQRAIFSFKYKTSVLPKGDFDSDYLI